MNASELRIGNWVNDFNGETNLYFKVSALSTTEINAIPIPLTEQILLKAGFDDDSYANFTKRVDQNVWVCISFKDYAHTQIIENPDVSDYRMPVKCIYLHTLQNLWYAITGTELEINLGQ